MTWGQLHVQCMFINHLNTVYERNDLWESYRDGFGIKFCEDEISSFKVVIEVDDGAERNAEYIVKNQ